MSEATRRSIRHRMERELGGDNNAHSDGVFYCQHEWNACECQKRKPGCFFSAFEHFREARKKYSW
jgi:histidinol phosphatase-like enzyme